jgi:hypothetical protein
MTRKRHDNPNRAEHNRKADPKRNLRRKTARVLYLMRLVKEKEIGFDPLHDHSRGRNETCRAELRSAWLKASREYDERNAA